MKIFAIYNENIRNFLEADKRKRKGTWNIGEIIQSKDFESNFHGKRILFSNQKVKTLVAYICHETIILPIQ